MWIGNIRREAHIDSILFPARVDRPVHQDDILIEPVVPVNGRTPEGIRECFEIQVSADKSLSMRWMLAM